MQSSLKLLSAVAAKRSEDITCHALRMHTAEHVHAVPDIALYECHMMLSGYVAGIAVSHKISVFCRQMNHSLTVDMLLIGTDIICKLLDGYEH